MKNISVDNNVIVDDIVIVNIIKKVVSRNSIKKKGDIK